MTAYEPYVAALFIGAGATFIQDLWNWLLFKLFKLPSMSFCLVGRWFSYMRLGVFRHQSISKAQPQSAECWLGWLSHYLIGITFALLLTLPNAGQWQHNPSLGMALLVGIGTVVMPFFLMQPAFGLGIAAAKTPAPTKARVKSLLTHSVFGVGLYLSGCIFSMLSLSV